MPFLTAGPVICVYAVGQILHVVGLFLSCLDKLPLESLYWTCNLVKNIVTCCLFLLQLMTSGLTGGNFDSKDLKYLGNGLLSYTWKIMVLTANRFCHCGICAVSNSHIDTESTWGQFLSPCQISNLSTNDFRKHRWAIFLLHAIADNFF